MSKIGYARVSSKEQNLDRQLNTLKKAHITKIFQDKKSGKNTQRNQLQAMLNYIREDDEVIVSSLDRLSRNYDDIKNIINQIRDKGATFLSLDLMTNTTGNPLMDKFIQDMLINMLSFVAQNEREKIHERQKQGIQIAKQKGLYNGRPPKFTNDSQQVQRAIHLHKSNTNLSMIDIAKLCDMSRATLYRILKRNKQL